MKIVDVAGFYSPLGGGVKTYIEQKMALGAARGHEVVVIAPAEADGTEERPGGRIHYVRSPKMWIDGRYHQFWSAKPVHRLLDMEQPDLVEASSPWQSGHILAAWKGDVPRILFMHSDPVASYPHQYLGRALTRTQIDRLFEWFWFGLRRLARRYDETIVGGDWLARRLTGEGVANVRAIPFGVDTELFTPARRSAALRRELLARCGLGEQDTLLVGIGRHHPEKRWPLVIEAAAAARHGDRRAGVVLLGDGIGRRGVEKAAAAVDQTVVMGQVADRSELARILASADGLIHGCASETFGLVAGEALAAGVPLIVPGIGGASELARPAWSETFAQLRVNQATAAVERFMARDRGLMAAAAARAGETLVGPASGHFERLFAHYEALTGLLPATRVAALAA